MSPPCGEGPSWASSLEFNEMFLGCIKSAVEGKEGRGKMRMEFLKGVVNPVGSLNGPSKGLGEMGINRAQLSQGRMKLF